MNKFVVDRLKIYGKYFQTLIVRSKNPNPAVLEDAYTTQRPRQTRISSDYYIMMTLPNNTHNDATAVHLQDLFQIFLSLRIQPYIAKNSKIYLLTYCQKVLLLLILVYCLHVIYLHFFPRVKLPPTHYIRHVNVTDSSVTGPLSCVVQIQARFPLNVFPGGWRRPSSLMRRENDVQAGRKREKYCLFSPWFLLILSSRYPIRHRDVDKPIHTEGE